MFAIFWLKPFDCKRFLHGWDLAIGETNVMIGIPAETVITNTYLEGIIDFDVEIPYNA
mgnify:CR=1 FL=1